jgi:DNA-binding NtrC family response regulator
MNFMQRRQWPGNIRELENFVERLVTLAAPEMAALNQKILPPEFQLQALELLPIFAQGTMEVFGWLAESMVWRSSASSISRYSGYLLESA